MYLPQMKLDLAIHSSDSNPLYLDFWPLVSRMWKQHIGVDPVLIYIDENQSISIDETYGKVIRMKPIPGVPVYLQCLWVRYWYPSQHPDKVSIICDIDMFPISKRYFLEQIKDVSDSKYVHLNPIKGAPLPSCYHVAKGYLFKKVLQLPDSWEQSIRELFSSKLGSTHYAFKGFDKWGADESYATQKLNEYPQKDIFHFIKRNHRRIDRSHWEYTIEDIKNDIYADSHSIRPYSNILYRQYIDKLIDEIYKYAA